jgi:hypothetical protein
MIVSARPLGKGRAAYAFDVRVLPAAAREEAKKRENQDHDEDDPEDAHLPTPSLRSLV